MTFERYVKVCNKMLENHPEYGKLPVIAASDDEGNSYFQVIFTPGTIVVDDPESNKPEPVNPEGLKPNAICIN